MKMMTEQQCKIGLEIHMHLNTVEKLFCTCRLPQPDDEENLRVCPRCTGQPGAKPMLANRRAVEQVIRLALVFGATITRETNFQRKHYAWPDMPTGYQRTISGGHIQPSAIDGSFKDVGIEELHLEEDPAAWDPETGSVNYNRAGFPLAEIVTRPDFTSTDQLRAWLEELMLVAEYLGVLHADYGIKADVNVSIPETGYQRVEIKNVNSFSNIVAAAEAEIARQRQCAETGETVSQQTRRYDEQQETTQFMRTKEDAADYRFTPEPDLPVLQVDDVMISGQEEQIPELPAAKRERYATYGLGEEDVEVLVSHRYLAELFEHALEEGLQPREVGLFLRREVMRVLNYQKATFADLEQKDIKTHIATLLRLLSDETIAYTTAQQLLEQLYEQPFDVVKYVEEQDLKQVQDTSQIRDLVRNALQEAPQAIEDFKSGKNPKALHFIIGIVMRETKGTADPKVVNSILEEEVENF